MRCKFIRLVGQATNKNERVSKHGVKMKAAVAVQRKLLEMIYTIYKTNALFDKDYRTKHGTEQQKAAA